MFPFVDVQSLKQKITEIFVITVVFIIILAVMDLDPFGIDISPIQPYIIGLYSVTVVYLIINFLIDTFTQEAERKASDKEIMK